MNKIIHIVEVPLYRTLAQNLFIRESIENGLQVEYWDLSEIYYPGGDSSYEEQLCSIKKFSTLSQFEKALEAEDRTKTLFNVQMHFNYKNRHIFRLIKKCSCLSSFINSGYIPIIKQTQTQRIITYSRAPGLLVMKSLQWLLFKIYKHYFSLKRHEYVFAAGKIAAENFPPETKIVKINFGDYETYLQTRDETDRVIHEKYWVFIDQYLPYHPDNAYQGVKAVNPGPYFQALRNFFDILESQHQIEIVIALHPKANYTSNAFGDRKYYKFRSSELIRDTEMVISHDSTAVGLAVMYEKPIILIYDDEIERISRDPKFNEKARIILFADTLGTTTLNVSRLPKNFSFSIPLVNKELYHNYKYTYLAWPETESISSAELFISAILGI